MGSHTVYFTGMMVFTFTSQMYHRISVPMPVLVRIPEYLSTSTSTSMSTMTLELTSTSTVRVQEIQYSSTTSTSTPALAQRYRLTHSGEVMHKCWLVNRVLIGSVNGWCQQAITWTNDYFLSTGPSSSVGNYHRSAGPRATTLEEIHGTRT